MEIANIVQSIYGPSSDFEGGNLPHTSPSIIEDGRQFSNYFSSFDILPAEDGDRLLSISVVGKSAISTIGEKLVAKLDAVGSDFKANMVKAQEEMNKAPDQWSVRDVLKLEYELAIVSLQVDLISKGVQKAVQNIDTLVKIQG